MRYLALIFAFLVSTFCSAQSDSLAIPKWSLVTKPFYVIDPLNQGLEVGVAYQLSKTVSVQLRSGPLFSLYKAGSNFKKNNYVGYRFAAEMQYNLLITNYENYYVAVEYLYKDFTRTKQEWFLRMGNKYQQQLLLSKYYHVHGMHIKVGLNTIQSSRRTAFDFYGGVGVRAKNVSFSPLPEDATFLEQSNFENETVEGRSQVPVLFIGMIMHIRFANKN